MSVNTDQDSNPFARSKLCFSEEQFLTYPAIFGSIRC